MCKHFPYLSLPNTNYASYENQTIGNEFGFFCHIIITQFNMSISEHSLEKSTRLPIIRPWLPLWAYGNKACTLYIDSFNCGYGLLGRKILPANIFRVRTGLFIRASNMPRDYISWYNSFEKTSERWWCTCRS